MATDNTQEEVTTIENQPPQQVVRKTTTQTEPQVKGEAPQKVYEKKKAIFRFNQVIWLILGFIEVMLAFRFVLKLLGANPFVGFTSLIYSITGPLTIPFSGILGVTVSGNNSVEWSTIIAGIVYFFVAWGLAYLLGLIYPITPNDVETQ